MAANRKKKNDMPCTIHHVDPSAWPPPPNTSAAVNRAKEQREIDITNMHLQKKLTDAYKPTNPFSFSNQTHLAKPVDCNRLVPKPQTLSPLNPPKP